MVTKVNAFATYKNKQSVFQLPTSVSQYSGSVWVSENARPEYFTQTWRDMYAAGEPNHSGNCLYLSRTYNYLWRDTACSRRKLPLCQYLGDTHPCNKGKIEKDSPLIICMRKMISFPIYSIRRWWCSKESHLHN